MFKKFNENKMKLTKTAIKKMINEDETFIQGGCLPSEYEEKLLKKGLTQTDIDNLYHALLTLRNIFFEN